MEFFVRMPAVHSSALVIRETSTPEGWHKVGQSMLSHQWTSYLFSHTHEGKPVVYKNMEHMALLRVRHATASRSENSKHN